MFKTLLSALLATTCMPLAVQAAPASQTEADRLTTVFERYLGRSAVGEPVRVGVTPEGDTYKVKIDLKPVLSFLQAEHVTLDIPLQTMVLTPQDNGLWHVVSEPQMPIVIHTGAQSTSVETKVDAKGYRSEGTFDPKLGTYSDASGTLESLSLDQSAPGVTQHERVGKSTSILKAVPAEGGTISIDSHSTLADLADDMVLTQPAAHEAGDDASPEAPVAISMRSPLVVSDISVDKIHLTDLLDLWAFFVAHPNRDSIVSAQDDLRGLLRKAHPFLNGLSQKVAFDQMSVTSPAGPFAARRFVADVHLADLFTTGQAGLAMSLDGLTVPTQKLPAWTVGLIPSLVDIKTKVAGFHFSEAAKAAIDGFDLKRDEMLTSEQMKSVGDLAWPSTGGKVILEPSRLTSDLLSLQMDGEASVSEATQSGRLSITGVGIDKVITMLQAAAASDPTAAQVLSQVVTAKNLAKPGPDGSLIWVVEASNAGPLTVNGIPLQ